MTCEVFLTVVISLEVSNVVDSVVTEGNYLSYIFNVSRSRKTLVFYLQENSNIFDYQYICLK